MKIFYSILFLIIIFSSKLFSQSLEEGINFVNYYLISEEHKEILSSSPHPIAVDSLFHNTLRFYNYNYAEALLALTFGTLPFSEMPLRLPVFQIKMALPLPSGPKQIFKEKMKYLPSKLFSTSPKSNYGDKDKLPHFFGSAYLAYNESFLNISKFMGILVEMFEESFEVQGRIDIRDMQINDLGRAFGNSLKENPNSLPSKIMNLNLLQNTNYFVR